MTVPLVGDSIEWTLIESTEQLKSIKTKKFLDQNQMSQIHTYWKIQEVLYLSPRKLKKEAVHMRTA